MTMSMTDSNSDTNSITISNTNILSYCKIKCDANGIS